MGLKDKIIDWIEKLCNKILAKISKYREKIMLSSLSELHNAVWIEGDSLHLSVIVEWINNKIEDWWGDKETAHANGAKATIVNGEALSNFISQQQKTGNYREISLDELNQIQKSTINIMSDKNNQGESEMIGAEKGYDDDLRNGFFKGKSSISISI